MVPAVIIPLLVKFGIPAATYAIGHLIGFFHGKKKEQKKVEVASGSLGIPGPLSPPPR